MKKTTTTLVAAALLAVGTAAFAQGFPTAKPIRLIVGYPPGGGIDFAARTVQVPLQEALKQQLVVDYKPGASGMIAATELTRQPADGYTLLLANTGPFAIAPYLQSKPPYDPIRQVTWFISSPFRCVEVPLPPEAKLTLPGCPLAHETNSLRFFAGWSGRVTAI
jgi:tripartite-type tricarboxylate transporter receptor subunit TctC